MDAMTLMSLRYEHPSTRPNSNDQSRLSRPDIAAIIVAAGRGRGPAESIPKQYRLLAGRPVLAHSLALFAGHEAIARSIAVIHPADRDLYDAAAPAFVGLADRLIGGDSRQSSCFAGSRGLDAEQSATSC